jgi:hypothetical protein
MGDYATSSGGYTIPIVVPTRIRVFSLALISKSLDTYLVKRGIRIINNY